ncbi:MAG: ArnT family glycosyltransferase [Leptonema sp. (in: bacteria)]
MYIIFIVLLYILLHFYYGEYYPKIWPDEVLFSSAAKNFAFSNQLKTDVLEGIVYGMDKATLWMTPLYLVFLSFVYRIFEESLIVGRSFSLIIGILSLLLYYKVFLRITKDRQISLFFMFLLSIEHSFIRSGNIIRMEILNLFFVFSTIYFLEKRKENLIGISLGLAGLTHPISLFLVLIFFLYITDYKKIVKIAMIALLVMSPWFYYLFQHLEIFKFQFLSQLSRKTSHYDLKSLIYFIKVIGGQFQSNVNFILVYLFYIYTFIIGILNVNSYPKKYLIMTLVVFAFVFFSSESWYVVYIFPFMFLLLGITLVYSKNLKKQVLTFSFLIIFTIQINLIYKLQSQKGLYNYEYELFINFLNKNLEDCKTVFLQSIPDPYFHLERNKIYKEFPPYGLFFNRSTSLYSLQRLETYKQIDCFVISDQIKSDKELEELFHRFKGEKILFPDFSLLPTGFVYKVNKVE